MLPDYNNIRKTFDTSALTRSSIRVQMIFLPCNCNSKINLLTFDFDTIVEWCNDPWLHINIKLLVCVPSIYHMYSFLDFSLGPHINEGCLTTYL